MSYDVEHCAFVLKDGMESRLPGAVRRACAKRGRKNDPPCLIVGDPGRAVQIPQGDILYLEHQGRRPGVWTLGGTLAAEEKLEALLARLDPVAFCQTPQELRRALALCGAVRQDRTADVAGGGRRCPIKPQLPDRRCGAAFWPSADTLQPVPRRGPAVTAALEIVLVSALPVAPAYMLGVYAIRFLLTPPQSPGGTPFLRCTVRCCWGIKPVIDFYWQYTNEARPLAILHGAVLTLTLPVLLWYCFGGDWRRRLFVLFPYVCIQSVFIMPPIILLLQTGLPLRPVWQVMFLAASALACGLAVLVTERLARLVEKLPGPVYTALGGRPPPVGEPAAQPGPGP